MLRVILIRHLKNQNWIVWLTPRLFRGLLQGLMRNIRLRAKMYRYGLRIMFWRGMVRGLSWRYLRAINVTIFLRNISTYLLYLFQIAKTLKRRPIPPKTDVISTRILSMV